MFEQTKEYLIKLGYPRDDSCSIEFSEKEFHGGGHYGIELSSMNNPQILDTALKCSKRHDISIDRVVECRGIMRLPDREISDMVSMCDSERIGLIMSIGPRSVYDIGGFERSKNGRRVGYRLRGMDNIVYAVEEVRRGVSLGVRGFLVYDEGLLYLLNMMRRDGFFKKNIFFKFSVHAGCSNPMSALLLEKNGADTINLIPDLTISQLASIRRTVNSPLDIFTDTAQSAGGFIRTYDIPNIIRHASPVFLKCGPVSQPNQNHLPSTLEIDERVKQARNVYEHIMRHLPGAERVGHNEKTIALPDCRDERGRKLFCNSQPCPINKL